MVKTVCVCGAGTMGSGIAQVVAQAGFTTIQFDPSAQAIEKSKASINRSINSLVAKGRLEAEESEIIMNRLAFTTNFEECRGDVIIEAIVENSDAKISLFNHLQSINKAETVYATNTSSLSIRKIAAEIQQPGMLVGMHFFNPAPIMQLVEVVTTNNTSNKAFDIIFNLTKQLGKTPVVCKDVPGFIVNRVARQYYLEAMKLVEDGVADIETVDMVMEALGFRMGPFRLMDLIGLDINYSVSSIVYESLGSPVRLTPSSIQKSKVDSGHLGKKTGRGFYNYN